MDHWLHQASWLGNSAYGWILAGIGALIGYIVVYGAIRIVAARLKTLAARHPRNMALNLSAAVVGATRGWALLLIAIAVALQWLGFSPAADARLRWLVGKTGTIDGRLSWLVGALFAILVAYWVSAFIVGWLRRATPEDGKQTVSPIIYGLLTWFVELMVWVTLLLILLASAGVHIGAFIASLGVGGIAIAMAAKSVLEDLFASIAIGLDKPFEEGEFITFGTEAGTVRKVGVKSTRIDSVSGEEIAISNAVLLQQLVHNYARMKERRVVFGFRVPLDTPRERAAAITQDVNRIIQGEAKVRLDRGHLIAIEQEGFRYEFVYYVLDADYTLYCNIQQSINLAIMAELDRLGVPFATPATRLVGGTGGQPSFRTTPSAPEPG